MKEYLHKDSGGYLRMNNVAHNLQRNVISPLQDNRLNRSAIKKMLKRL